MNTILDEFKNAFRRSDNGLIQLILINIIVFLFVNTITIIANLSNSPAFEQFNVWAFYLPARFGEFLTRPWTLVTYFFTHQRIFHILFNMLFLYWFGKLINEYLGNRRLINIYILGGLMGGALYLLMYNTLPYFNARIPLWGMIGASASVYAVVTAAATLIPNYTFNLLLIGPVRIVYIALFFIIISYVSLGGNDNLGGHIAHLGGAFIGYLFIRQLRSGTDLGKPLTYMYEKMKDLFRKKPPIKVSYSNRTQSGNAAKSRPNAPNQDEIDAILDKISTSGYESLSKEEKQKLFSASQKNQ
jgi:membrane associated rhomboid family serine protease